LKIETTRFGTVTIKADEIIDMPFGIPGFPYQTKFFILEHKKDSPFLWYQSSEDPSLAFVITDPLLFKPDYVVNMDKVITELSWEQEVEKNQLKLYVIVNIPNGAPHKTTANLIGPLVMNPVTRQAVQIIIPDSPYSHQFPLT
jgi:flagellar assembly factor FliW